MKRKLTIFHVSLRAGFGEMHVCRWAQMGADGMEVEAVCVIVE